jgi:spore germination protein KA
VEQKYFLLDDKTEIGIVYIDSIANKEYISKQVIEPLLRANFDSKVQPNNMLSLIQSKFTYIPDSKTSSEMQKVTEGLLQGNTILFINGLITAIIIRSPNMEKRSIEKPDNEPALFGSMDSFTEDVEINCSLLIRRLPTPDLRFEEFTVGKLSNTKVKLLWIENIANTKAVKEVRQRIQSIDFDSVAGIGVLSELIEDHPLSVFPKFRQTQRPDVTTKYLTDGHFAVLCSNSPYAFLAPVTLWDHFKTTDDYTDKSLVASYLRIFRLVAFLVSILISPLYLAFVTYHQSVVPPALAQNIASGREGVPFPSLVELLLLTIIIGIIREAALRIPSSVGFFVGLLGAIVIGQSAVTAGYVSASVIIVVATSAISGFGISSNIMVVPSRLINYFLIILSGFLGMFGLINGIAIVIWHLVRQESFGMPYMYPLVPFDPEAMKDTFIRAPFYSLKKRFEILVKNNRQKVGSQGIK